MTIAVPQRALGFILWLFDAQPHPGLRPFTAFCALALASDIGFGDLSEEEIAQICDWVDAEEERCRNALGDHVESQRWLIGLNSYELGDRDEKWLLLARQAFRQPLRAHSARIGATLQRFSDRLAET